MNEELVLILWLNSLDLESTNTVDTLGDVSLKIMVDVVNHLLGVRPVRQKKSETIHSGDLEIALRRFEGAIGVNLDILIQKIGSVLSDDGTKVELLRFLRQVHRAKSKLSMSERTSDEEVSPISDDKGHSNDLTPPPPPPPPPPTPYDGNQPRNRLDYHVMPANDRAVANSGKSNQPSPEIPPLPPRSTPPSMLRARILELVPLGEFLEARLGELSQRGLADGVLLCGLVLAFEKKLGMAPRRDAVLRRVSPHENLLFFTGVEVQPRSRAPKLKNVEAALEALRQWKGFNPKFLWSGPNIVDCTGNEGLELVEQMVHFVERFFYQRHRRRIGTEIGAPALQRKHQTQELVAGNSTSESPESYDTDDRDWSISSDAPANDAPNTSRVSSPSRPQEILISSPEGEGGNNISQVQSPSGSLGIEQQDVASPSSPPPSWYPEPILRHGSSIMLRRPSLRSVGFVSLQSPPPPPPPPPTGPASPNIPSYSTCPESPKTPPPRLPLQLELEASPSFSEENDANDGLENNQPLVARKGTNRNGPYMFSNQSNPLPTSTSVPPLLEPSIVRAKLIRVDSLCKPRLAELFSRPRPIALTVEEKYLARMYLYHLGFNLLRTSVHPYRTVSPDRAATKEFAGYEGGPFLSDPLRNGRILVELAGILERALLGVSYSPRTEASAFPDAQQRVGHALNRLEALAMECGMLEVSHSTGKRSDASGVLFGATAQEHILSGNPEAWTLIYVLSLVFPIDYEDEEHNEVLQSLHSIGIIASFPIQGERLSPQLMESISCGDLLRKLAAWWTDHRIHVLRSGGETSAIGNNSTARTRKTAIASIEKSLEVVGVKSTTALSLHIVAQRIHDGDLRLFFRVLASLRLSDYGDARDDQNSQVILQRHRPLLVAPLPKTKAMTVASSSAPLKEWNHQRTRDSGLGANKTAITPFHATAGRSLPRQQASVKSVASIDRASLWSPSLSCINARRPLSNHPYQQKEATLSNRWRMPPNEHEHPARWSAYGD